MSPLVRIGCLFVTSMPLASASAGALRRLSAPAPSPSEDEVMFSLRDGRACEESRTIANRSECKQAAKYLGIRFQGVLDGNADQYPRGCFAILDPIQGQEAKEMWWNVLDFPPSSWSWTIHSVCEGPPPTAPPTAAPTPAPTAVPTFPTLAPTAEPTPAPRVPSSSSALLPVNYMVAAWGLFWAAQMS